MLPWAWPGHFQIRTEPTCWYGASGDSPAGAGLATSLPVPLTASPPSSVPQWMQAFRGLPSG
jgi:hypothetical protein